MATFSASSFFKAWLGWLTVGPLMLLSAAGSRVLCLSLRAFVLRAAEALVWELELLVVEGLPRLCFFLCRFAISAPSTNLSAILGYGLAFLYLACAALYHVFDQVHQIPAFAKRASLRDGEPIPFIKASEVVRCRLIMANFFDGHIEIPIGNGR